MGDVSCHINPKPTLESTIDSLVYTLYNLSDDETEFIINYDLQFRTDD